MSGALNLIAVSLVTASLLTVSSVSALAAEERRSADIGVEILPSVIRLHTGSQVYAFEKDDTGAWTFAGVSVNGVPTALPLNAEDSFFRGGGRAQRYTVLSAEGDRRAVQFHLKGDAAVTYQVDAKERLPLIHVAITGPKTATVAYRTVAADEAQRGAWVTRGEVASDAEGREVFIDGSGPLVFGHSRAGSVDAAYVLLAEVHKRIQTNGRTEQKSGTWFKSESRDANGGERFGYWQLRMGEGEPTRYALLFDRDLGGRFSSVCEKYYAAAVDTLVDVGAAPSDYDADKALQKFPLRLSAPDAFIPGYGWVMEEYGDAAYPYGHTSCLQTGNFLAYEGLATGREWEKNFGKWVVDKSPLLSKNGREGDAYFVRRAGGVTRWGYFADYKSGFARLDGANWGDSQSLYDTAKITGDAELKRIALEMMHHDVDIKLNLHTMYFAPCWDVLKNAPGDHRDDWAITALLGYAAELCTQCVYPETGDKVYLQKADRICQWFRSILGPETRMNYLNEGVNMHNCWVGWIPTALIRQYERTKDSAYLDIAKDIAWVQIMTLGVTSDTDTHGRSFTGVTCVGVRGCIDYDCSPHLCQEKDQAFLDMMGVLLDHVHGSAYAKYLELQRLALPRDGWNAAFEVQELRDLNLRTMYDTYPRAMTNLCYALNHSDDRRVAVVEKLVLKRALDIGRRRDIVLANGTATDRKTQLHIRCLQPGQYRLRLDGEQKILSAAALSEGVEIAVPANTMRSLKVEAISLSKEPAVTHNYDASVTYLSDLREAAAQRGVGLPEKVFVRDCAFGGGPLKIGEKMYDKGLCCAANTVIVYDLSGKYRRFASVVGIDAAVINAVDPPPSVTFTVFVDGVCRFDSGAMKSDTAPKPIKADLTGAKTLVLRVSGNWDNCGNTKNDLALWASARLIGRAK